MSRTSRVPVFLMPALISAAGVLALLAPTDAVSAPRSADDREAKSSTLALPGPAPRAGHSANDAARTNDQCVDCHKEIAAEWRGSLHKAAYVDPVFQEALALEPFGFCRGCHAPEGDPKAAPAEAAQSVGVSCTTCHVQGEDVVGADSRAAGSGAHAVVGDARMRTEEACGACHQFDFPATQGAPMQNTLAEHAGSKLGSVTCQGCHMKTVDDGNGRAHTSHAFSVISDPAMIRSAANVSAERANAREVRVAIEPAIVGHAFPTGDMFRRLEIRARAVDARGEVVQTAPVVHLVRSFADRPNASKEADFARVEVGDSRVPAPGSGEGRRVLLRFDRPVGGLTIRWSVVYQRMGTAMAASFGVAQAHDEIVVAEGALAPAVSSNRDVDGKESQKHLSAEPNKARSTRMAP